MLAKVITLKFQLHLTFRQVYKTALLSRTMMRIWSIIGGDFMVLANSVYFLGRLGCFLVCFNNLGQVSPTMLIFSFKKESFKKKLKLSSYHTSWIASTQFPNLIC